MVNEQAFDIVIAIKRERKRMKELFGGPGRVSGLVLRMGQCLFAAASMVVMASSHGFATCTAFW